MRSFLEYPNSVLVAFNDGQRVRRILNSVSLRERRIGVFVTPGERKLSRRHDEKERRAKERKGKSGVFFRFNLRITESSSASGRSFKNSSRKGLGTNLRLVIVGPLCLVLFRRGSSCPNRSDSGLPTLIDARLK